MFFRVSPIWNALTLLNDHA